MNRSILIATILAAGCAYQAPVAPTPLPIASSTPTPSTPTTPTPPVTIAPITVDLLVSPSTPHKGDHITMTASSAGGTAPLSYAWTFGDGAWADGPSATLTHAYDQDGLKTIRLTVTDANGRTGSGYREMMIQSNVVVSNDPPVVLPPPAPTPPQLPTLSTVATCTGNAHGSPSPCNVNTYYGGSVLPSSAISNVDWDWGDGLQTAAGGVVSAHSYVNAGTYNVFATVTATTVDGPKTATTFRSLVVP